MFSWSFRFARKYVLSLPVHVLECALLPVQEKLFASWFARASEADEWCDNESTCIAANERKPKDPRLLLFILERVDLLDLAGDPQGPVRRLSPTFRQRDNILRIFEDLSDSCDSFNRDAAITACEDEISSATYSRSENSPPEG